jgi:catalase
LSLSRLPIAALALIVLLLGASAAAFAFTAGWLSPDRLTPARMVAALGNRGGDPAGHRRNHSKGICFTGRFEASGAGSALSTAPMFAAGRYPVIGRFAIAVGNPAAPDDAGRVKSMAIRVVAPDGQEWRSAMNASPVFPVADPAAFYDLTLAAAILPATGKPDPAAMPAFVAAHQESKPFLDWAASAPWTASYADQTYRSLNAFRLVDAGGAGHAVRWAMTATLPEQPVAKAELAALGPDYLERRWRMMVTLAQPGDPTADATRAWPADRPAVEFGTLVVEQAQREADGPCRDYNFDPTILPSGMALSDDPLLPARSSAYAYSFDLRTAEAEAYPPAGTAR